MSATSPQQLLTRHYEGCFERHGRTPQGVDWPDARDLATRFDVMLDIVPPGEERASVLDLGCGPGLLLDHLVQRGRGEAFDYLGVDLSEPMLASARALWPQRRFERRDILVEPYPPRAFDYVLMNGLLTERRSISREAMAAYAVELLAAAFDSARFGIAFNAMSPLVDWEREDLFHWGFDAMTAAVASRLSRHIVIRADYGLYDYTVHVLRESRRGEPHCGAPRP